MPTLEKDDAMRIALTGVAAAWGVAFGYASAILTGSTLGAWSAGVDIVGLQPCMWKLFEKFMGLGMLRGLVSFLGIALSAALYFKTEKWRWDLACLSVLLWTYYCYLGLGSGAAEPMFQTILPPKIPEWRIYASELGIVSVYAVGLFLRSGWPGRGGSR